MIKVGKLINLFKILGTECYGVNFVFMSYPKDGLLKLVKFQPGTFLVFQAFEKKMVKFFGNNTMTS